MAPDETHRAIEAVWRIESAKLIAALARIVGDVGLAEDLAQDALVAALERWPESGVPDNPGAWLMGTAKHRAIDHLRRHRMLERKHGDLGHELEARQVSPEAELVAALDDDIGDDLLRLMFMCCHPVLSTEARVALTLRLLGGLTTEEIARAFLVPESTVAQRIVRAKRTLREARVPFEVPHGGALAERLASVLGVVYLIFNEGYAATAGDDWTRPALCEDALRLGRILAELAPAEPEVHGLVALMEIQASRLRARTGPAGEPVLLLDQDRGRWDQLLIRRGLSALARAESLGGALGPYALQAAIAACHARARTPDETDWERISALYDALAELAPSPVVALNRAVALAMAFGPAAGLEVVDALAAERALEGYHLLPAVRADFLAKLGRLDEARAELARAASLTKNARERALLLARAAGLGRPRAGVRDGTPALPHFSATAAVPEARCGPRGARLLARPDTGRDRWPLLQSPGHAMSLPTTEFGLSRIGQIAIPVADLPSAVAFYRDTLGLRFLFEAPPQLAFFDCGGIRLMLSTPEGTESAQTGSVIYFTTDDITAAHAALVARGVVFEQEPHAIARLPNHDVWMAFFRDNQRNLLALMSEVPRG